MAKNKFMENLIMGDGEYKKLPKTRKEQFFKNIKENYGILILLSFITFLFIIPALFTLYMMSYQININIEKNPNDINNIILSINFYTSLIMIACLIILGIAMSGLSFVIRKMVYGEIFHFQDFFEGIKKNYQRFIFIFFLYGISLAILIIDVTYYSYIAPFKIFINYLFISLGIIQFIIMSIMVNFMMMQEVRYNLSKKDLVKNSFILTMKLFFKNSLIFILNIIPWIIIIIVPGIYQLIILSILLFTYFGFNILLNEEYTTSIFDKYININQYESIYKKGLEE